MMHTTKALLTGALQAGRRVLSCQGALSIASMWQCSCPFIDWTWPLLHLRHYSIATVPMLLMAFTCTITIFIIIISIIIIVFIFIFYCYCCYCCCCYLHTIPSWCTHCQAACLLWHLAENVHCSWQQSKRFKLLSRCLLWRAGAGVLAGCHTYATDIHTCHKSATDSRAFLSPSVAAVVACTLQPTATHARVFPVPSLCRL